MKSNKLFAFTCLMLTLLIINSQFTNITASNASTTQSSTSYSGLRVNRVLLTESNVTFVKNDNFTIFLLIENLGNLNVKDLNFNYTVDSSLFAIISSTNSTENSNKSVYFNFDQINPGQKVSFNMTLQVVSNRTQSSITLEAMTLNYKYSEFDLPGSLSTPSLKVNIRAESTVDTKPQKVFGSIDVDSVIMALIFALPILIGFLLSFIFGRRRNKA